MKKFTAYEMYEFAAKACNLNPTKYSFSSLMPDFQNYYSFLALNVMSDNLETLIIEKHPQVEKDCLKVWAKEYYRNIKKELYKDEFIGWLKDET